MSIDEIGKLRIEPSVKAFMKGSVGQERGETGERNVSCIKCNISKGKRGLMFILKTGSILKNFS